VNSVARTRTLIVAYFADNWLNVVHDRRTNPQQKYTGACHAHDGVLTLCSGVSISDFAIAKRSGAHSSICMIEFCYEFLAVPKGVGLVNAASS
jgi:hypothetical protein